MLTKVIGKNLESLKLISTALIVGGIVTMWWTAFDGARRQPAFNTAVDEVERMTMPQAIWIGLCQTLSALFPGTSRSMATIAAGQTAGLSRTAALEFSFLLSIPTMAAATGYDLLKTLRPSKSTDPVAPLHIDSHGWILLAIGFVVSFFVAWAVVAWFMQSVRKRGFTPFAIYRIAAGVAAVLVWAMR